MVAHIKIIALDSIVIPIANTRAGPIAVQMQCGVMVVTMSMGVNCRTPACPTIQKAAALHHAR
jgi:hypothetical protein